MQAIRRFIWLIITLFVLAAVASFAVSNKSQTVLAFWPLGDIAQLPLWAVVLGALCAGLLGGALLVWLAGLPQRTRLRARERRIVKLETEVAELKAEKEDREQAGDTKPALPGQAS
jgi:uncharacterized integral membrane protein